MRKNFSILLHTMQLFLFPEENGCIFCGKKVYEESFCQKCWAELSLGKKQEFCRICGRLVKNICSFGCSECQDSHYQFSFARAAGGYQGIHRDILHQFKYIGKQSLAQPMGKLMVDVILSDRRYEGTQVIVPVPLAPAKLAQRKFNQSRLLAEELGKTLGLPVLSEGLRRGRNTQTQAKLSREERRTNLEGVFEVPAGKLQQWKRKKLLLVDDVFTTGSTASEATKVLLAAGVGEVTVITWATGSTMLNERERRDWCEFKELS